MRKIRDILRLRLSAGLSIRAISASTKVSVGAIQKLLSQAHSLALDWPLPADPDLNPSYQQLAAHYQLAVVPARPYKPKDKAKAEVGVQVAERWILARLRQLKLPGMASAL